MTRKDAFRFIVLRSIGNFLLLFALFGVGMTFGPTLYYEANFRIDQARGVSYTIASVKDTASGSAQTAKPVDQSTGGFASLVSGQKEHLLIPKDTLFSILIPKIGATSKVFPNVDSKNQEEYLEVLKQGVAHVKGTVFPGMKGNTYLFAHSTDNFWNVGRYNALFYLLKDLEPGDDIVVFFEDVRHNYRVVEKKVIDGSDVSYIVNSQKTEEEALILQTCWPPGTTWKRLLIIAKPFDQL